MGHNYIETKIIHANYFCLLSLNWLRVHYSFWKTWVATAQASQSPKRKRKKPQLLHLCFLARERGKEYKVDRRGDGDRGPEENVILVSRVTQGPWLPDGALEGLVKAALGLRSQRSKNFSHTITQMAAKDSSSLIHSFKQSHIRHASCDFLLRSKSNLNRTGNVGQRPCNIWPGVQKHQIKTAGSRPRLSVTFVTV